MERGVDKVRLGTHRPESEFRLRRRGGGEHGNLFRATLTLTHTPVCPFAAVTTEKNTIITCTTRSLFQHKGFFRKSRTFDFLDLSCGKRKSKESFPLSLRSDVRSETETRGFGGGAGFAEAEEGGGGGGGSAGFLGSEEKEREEERSGKGCFLQGWHEKREEGIFRERDRSKKEEEKKGDEGLEY